MILTIQGRVARARDVLLPDRTRTEDDRPEGWDAVVWSVRTAAAPWVIARVVLLLARAVSRAVQGGVLPGAPTFTPQHAGWYVWDSGWYRDIAASGYASLPQDVLRFFPLFPLLGRAVGHLVGGPGAGVLLVAHASALVYGAALAWLVRVELGSVQLAKRTAWLVALSPGAVVLGLGYAEGLAGALTVGFFLWMRTDRPGSAAVAGVLAGLARPVGLVLVGAAALDMLLRPPRSLRDAVDRLVVVVSPLLGTAVYLLWVGNRFGDPLLPFSVTRNVYLRGSGLSNPFRVVSSLPYGVGRFDVRIDIILTVAALLLCVVSAFILPFPYTAWTAVTIFLAVTSSTAASLPRYFFSAFPLLVAAAVLARSEARWTVLITVSTAAFAVFAVIGFTPIYTL